MTRKRFQQALSRLQYVDDDDFNYIAVDENEFAIDPKIFEEKFTPLQNVDESNNDSLYKLKTVSKDTFEANESIHEDYSLFDPRDNTKHSIQSDGKVEVERKESSKSNCEISVKDVPQSIPPASFHKSKAQPSIHAKASCFEPYLLKIVGEN